MKFLVAALGTVLRGLGLSFALLVIVVAGLVAYAHHRFGPEEARSWGQDKLSALLHREVLIERIVLTPRGLKIVGLRVRRGFRGAERLDGPDGDLLVCGTALLTVKLEALLRRRLEFDTLRLESPRIALTRSADGTWDLADLFASTLAARGDALPLALAAAETIVADGVLSVDDRKRGRKISFDKFALRAEGFDLDRSFPLAVSFVNRISVASRTVVSNVSAAGSVNLAGLRWEAAAARVDRFSAEVDGVVIVGAGTATGLTRPVFEIEAESSAFGPERWLRWTGRDLKLSLPATRWNARVASPAPRLFNIERLVVETAAPPAASAAAAPTPALRGKVSLRATIEGRLDALQIKDAELSLRGFGAVFGTAQLEGLDLDATVADEFAVLQASVTKGKVTAYGNVFEDLAVSLSVAKQTLSVESLTLRWGGQRLRLRGRVDRLSAPKAVLISGNLDKLIWEDAQRLVAGIAAGLSKRAAAPKTGGERRPWVRTFKYVIPRSFPDTVGHLRVGEVRQENFWCRDLDLLWSLKGVTPALDKVSGEARVRFGPGRVADIPAVQDANTFLRVIFLPFVYMHKMNKFSVFSTATAYPKTLDFSRIESEYALAKGVAVTRYFHVDSGQLAAFAEGAADFGRERVDMNVLTRLTRYDGVLPEWWVDEAGRPAIGFRVHGDLNKPELDPRFKKIPVDEIERKLDEGRASGKKRFETIEKLQTLLRRRT